MDFAKRLAHRAERALIALGMFGEALREDDGAVDGADHFERSDVTRLASQTIAAVRALLGNEESGPRELLKNLRQQRQRDAVSVGNILSARGALGGRQVAEGDKSVIRFFSELQHPGTHSL